MSQIEGNNNKEWDEFLCCFVDLNKDDGVLKDTGQEITVNLERKYRATRGFSLHHVPGDGSCFYHAVIEGMRKSAKMWTDIITIPDSPDAPVTFCDFIVKWWTKYTSTISEDINEQNINEYLNYKFLRYITSESITTDLFKKYQEIALTDSELEDFVNIEEMKKAVKNDCGLFANEFIGFILNEAFHPFLRVVIVKEQYDNTRSIRHDDKKAKSYLWVLLRSQHYYLLRKTGKYKPNDDSFIEMIEYNDNETLKFVSRDWF